MRPASVCGALLALTLGACALARHIDPPLMRLAPASLGRAVAWQQHLTVSSRGGAQELDVLLEADAQAVALALLAFGQTAARLQWDGRRLAAEHAPGWPQAVPAERVLSDLQFVYWPASVLAAALPPGWALQADANRRVLAWQGRPVVEVSYPSAAVAELVNLEDGYRIRIESREAGGAP